MLSSEELSGVPSWRKSFKLSQIFVPLTSTKLFGSCVLAVTCSAGGVGCGGLAGGPTVVIFGIWGVSGVKGGVIIINWYGM